MAVPFGEIPHFPASTVVGHAGALVLGRSRGVPVAVMKGRVHYYEGYSLDAGRLPGPGARPPRRQDRGADERGRRDQRALRARRADGDRGPHQLLGQPAARPQRGRPGPALPRHERGLRPRPPDAGRGGLPGRARRCHGRVRLASPGRPTRRRPRSACSGRWAPTRWACPRCPRRSRPATWACGSLGLSCLTNMAAGVIKPQAGPPGGAGDRRAGQGGPARGARAHRHGGSEASHEEERTRREGARRSPRPRRARSSELARSPARPASGPTPPTRASRSARRSRRGPARS